MQTYNVATSTTVIPGKIAIVGYDQGFNFVRIFDKKLNADSVYIAAYSVTDNDIVLHGKFPAGTPKYIVRDVKRALRDWYSRYGHADGFVHIPESNGIYLGEVAITMFDDTAEREMRVAGTVRRGLNGERYQFNVSCLDNAINIAPDSELMKLDTHERMLIAQELIQIVTTGKDNEQWVNSFRTLNNGALTYLVSLSVPQYGQDMVALIHSAADKELKAMVNISDVDESDGGEHSYAHVERVSKDDFLTDEGISAIVSQAMESFTFSQN